MSIVDDAWTTRHNTAQQRHCASTSLIALNTIMILWIQFWTFFALTFVCFAVQFNRVEACCLSCLGSISFFFSFRFDFVFSSILFASFCLLLNVLLPLGYKSFFRSFVQLFWFVFSSFFFLCFFELVKVIHTKMQMVIMNVIETKDKNKRLLKKERKKPVKIVSISH